MFQTAWRSRPQRLNRCLEPQPHHCPSKSQASSRSSGNLDSAPYDAQLSTSACSRSENLSLAIANDHSRDEMAEPNLSERTTVCVWFVYSIQQKRDPTVSKPHGGLQIHDQTCEVVIADVPLSDLTNTRPAQSVIWLAESMFLDRVSKQHPQHWVINWEARYNGQDGPLLSSFRVLLPSNVD
jgi:hypothetical protein